MIVAIILSVIGVMVFGFFLVKRMDFFLKKNGAAPEPKGRDGDAPDPAGSDAGRVRREFEREGVWIREENGETDEKKDDE